LARKLLPHWDTDSATQVARRDFAAGSPVKDLAADDPAVHDPAAVAEDIPQATARSQT